MAVINAIATLIAMVTFLGIVWWAFSKGRSEANRQAAMLPFAVPDERVMISKKENSHE